MPISPDAKRITNKIYTIYGADNDYLFGIPSDKRKAIEAIVQVTIEMYLNEESESKRR